MKSTKVNFVEPQKSLAFGIKTKPKAKIETGSQEYNLIIIFLICWYHDIDIHRKVQVQKIKLK